MPRMDCTSRSVKCVCKRVAHGPARAPASFMVIGEPAHVCLQLGGIMDGHRRSPDMHHQGVPGGHYPTGFCLGGIPPWGYIGIRTLKNGQHLRTLTNVISLSSNTASIGATI
jgi:hypothetical protein